jgi:hypothetical protein
VGDGLAPVVSVPSGQLYTRKAQALSQLAIRPVEERRVQDTIKSTKSVRSNDDKLQTLKNYHRAKGLCFTCGEKWGHDYRCQDIVQLHVVQEMVDFLPSQEYSAPPSPSETFDDMELMQISVTSEIAVAPKHSIVLHCSIQDTMVVFLLDSGINNSFLSSEIANKIGGSISLLVPRRVKVAGGGILQCTHYIPQCTWFCGQHKFCSPFKILPLQGYDGILGMDWLSSHSPQLVDWGLRFTIKAHGCVYKANYLLNFLVL